jgi:hypothetical protein
MIRRSILGAAVVFVAAAVVVEPDWTREATLGLFLVFVLVVPIALMLYLLWLVVSTLWHVGLSILRIGRALKAAREDRGPEYDARRRMRR